MVGCTALITNDLLDCDCGRITDLMKVRILAERDEHIALLQINDQGAGQTASASEMVLR